MTGRVLALDVGSRRLGVAVSDPTGTVASPLATIPRRTPAEAAAPLALPAAPQPPPPPPPDAPRPEAPAPLAPRAAARGAPTVVAGLPVTLAGGEGPAAAAVRA